MTGGGTNATTTSTVTDAVLGIIKDKAVPFRNPFDCSAEYNNDHINLLDVSMVDDDNNTIQHSTSDLVCTMSINSDGDITEETFTQPSVNDIHNHQSMNLQPPVNDETEGITKNLETPILHKQPGRSVRKNSLSDLSNLISERIGKNTSENDYYKRVIEMKEEKLGN